LRRDDDQLIQSRIARFLDSILQNGLIDERQHLLRDDLRRRKKPRPESGTRENAGAERVHSGVGYQNEVAVGGWQLAVAHNSTANRQLQTANSSWRPVCLACYGKTLGERAGMRKLLISLVICILAMPLAAQWRRAG